MISIELTENEIKLILANLNQLSIPLSNPDAEELVICAKNLIYKLNSSINKNEIYE